MADTVANRITVLCTCGAKLGLRVTAAGHKARCPKCRISFIVPGSTAASSPTGPVPDYPPAVPPRQPTTAQYVSVRCPCGKSMRVPALANGRKARCLVCQKVFIISLPPGPTGPSAKIGLP